MARPGVALGARTGAPHELERQPGLIGISGGGTTLIAVLVGVAGLAVGFAIDRASAFFVTTWYDAGELDDPTAGDESSDGAEPRVTDEQRPPLAVLTTLAPYRTALVIGASAAVFGAVAYRYADSPWQLAIVTSYAAILLACTTTDFMSRHIPDAFTYPAIIGALAVGLLVPGTDTADVLLGGAVSGGLLFAYAMLPGGGLADAKLGLFTGLMLGLHHIFPALLVTALTGGLVALAILLASRLRDRRRPMPYGPYIAAGALYVLLTEGVAFRTF